MRSAGHGLALLQSALQLLKPHNSKNGDECIALLAACWQEASASAPGAAASGAVEGPAGAAAAAVAWSR